MAHEANWRDQRIEASRASSGFATMTQHRSDLVVDDRFPRSKSLQVALGERPLENQGRLEARSRAGDDREHGPESSSQTRQRKHLRILFQTNL
jgi:hypothetical protein